MIVDYNLRTNLDGDIDDRDHGRDRGREDEARCEAPDKSNSAAGPAMYPPTTRSTSRSIDASALHRVGLSTSPTSPFDTRSACTSMSCTFGRSARCTSSSIVDGPVFRRPARVLAYLGYIALVATTPLFLSAQTVQGAGAPRRFPRRRTSSARASYGWGPRFCSSGSCYAGLAGRFTRGNPPHRLEAKQGLALRRADKRVSYCGTENPRVGGSTPSPGTMV